MNACDVMTTQKVWACAETSDAQSVAKMMFEHNIGAIPVLDREGRLEGIVTDRDLCCKVLAKGLTAETPICEIMSEPVHFVRPETSLQEIESLMRQYKIRRVPVIDDEKKLKGFISIGDLAAHCGTPAEEHDLVDVMGKIRSTAA